MRTKIATLFITFFASLIGMYNVHASETYYIFDNIAESNIVHSQTTSGQTTTNKITISNLYSSEYYLFSVTELDGTDIFKYSNAELSTSSDVQIIDITDSSFYSYASRIKFYDEYENYTIFKTKGTTAEFTFETYSDVNYTVLKKTFFASDNITATSDIINDLSLTGEYLTNQVSDKLRVLSILYGDYYGTESMYFYLVSSGGKVLSDLTIKTTEGDEYYTFTVALVSSHNDIYKYRVASRYKDEVEEYLSRCMITDFNFNETYSTNFSLSDKEVADQVITFESEVDGEDRNVSFAFAENAVKTIKGETYYFDFQETSTFWGNSGAEYQRLFYVLFNFYANNEQVSEIVQLEQVDISYTASYYLENNSDADKIDDYSEVTSWMSECDADVKDYVGFKTESVVPGTFTYRGDELNESVLDYFRKWVQTDSQRYTTYEINTLASRLDVTNPLTEDVDFKGFDYVMYYGAVNEGDHTSLARERFVENFDNSGWFTGKTTMEYAPVIEELTFLSMDFTYENESYSVTIDDNDLTYKGESDVLPGAIVTDPEPDFFDKTGDLLAAFWSNVKDVYGLLYKGLESILGGNLASWILNVGLILLGILLLFVIIKFAGVIKEGIRNRRDDKERKRLAKEKQQKQKQKALKQKQASKAAKKTSTTSKKK